MAKTRPLPDISALVVAATGRGVHAARDAIGNRAMPLPRSASAESDSPPQLQLALDSPLFGRVKNDRTLMIWNFFSLSRDRVTELPAYDNGHVRIEVAGTKHGVATIWDKEIL